MEKKEIIRDLEKLKEIYAQHLTLSKRKGCFEVKITLEGHQHLMFLIGDLIKVCVLALDEGENKNDPKISSPHRNIAEVLRLVLDLIPYEHMEFIEEVEKLTRPT